MKSTAFFSSWTKRFILVSLIATGALSFTERPVAAMQAVAVVNAASFASDGVVTANTIVAAFGQFKTLNNQVYPAQTVPLPTILGGVSVKVNGIAAGLLIVTPGQINLVIPPTVATGTATIIVTNNDNTTVSGTCTIVASKPGVFTATATGVGAASAQTTFDGIAYEYTANVDGTTKPVNPGTKARPNYLVLYVTGLGNVTASQVKVTLLGVPGQILYAGPHGFYTGVDQINVRIPWELGGLGVMTIHVETTINNNIAAANDTTINLGGSIPPILATPITPGTTVNGALTYEDQIQTSGDNVYFFDAFIFQTTGPDVSVAIDLRSPGTTAGAAVTNATAEDPSFDALLLLYRFDNGQLTLVAQDDQTGGIGDGDIDITNDALLLSVLKQAGQYVLLVTTYDGNVRGTGPYTLNFKSNVITKINYGQTLNGTITTNSIKTSAGVYIDPYYFAATQGDRARVTMRSTAFDAFIFFYRNFTDPYVAFDDNSGGGNDAQVTYNVPTTDYYLALLTPFALNDTGAYSIQVQKITAFEGDTPAVTQASPLNGRLNRAYVDRRGPLPEGSESRFDRVAKRRFVIR
jgi:uncharacterized protein (TIGR03437 family)